MKKEVKKNNKGFSLVELIVVVAIMAVLMVVLAPAMLRYVEKTRIGKDDNSVGEVRKALENALAEEAVYNEANGGIITIQIDGDTGAMTFTNSGGGSSPATTLVEKEVKATVGDTISITSKDRKDKTCTIKAEYKSNRMGYVVEFDPAASNGWS